MFTQGRVSLPLSHFPVRCWQTLTLPCQHYFYSLRKPVIVPVVCCTPPTYSTHSSVNYLLLLILFSFPILFFFFFYTRAVSTILVSSLSFHCPPLTHPSFPVATEEQISLSQSLSASHCPHETRGMEGIRRNECQWSWGCYTPLLVSNIHSHTHKEWSSKRHLSAVMYLNKPNILRVNTLNSLSDFDYGHLHWFVAIHREFTSDPNPQSCEAQYSWFQYGQKKRGKKINSLRWNLAAISNPSQWAVA